MKMKKMKSTTKLLMAVIATIFALGIAAHLLTPEHVRDAQAVTWRTPGTSSQTVVTEESDKTGYAHYVAYTDNAITIEAASSAYITVTKEVDIRGFAPDSVTPDTNFTTIDISGAATPTLCGVVDAINGYTGYTATLVAGADCLLPAQDLVTVTPQDVFTAAHTFAETAADNLGISKLIPAAGTGKQIYVNRIVCAGTGSGAIKLAVYDGYSTKLWEETLTSATEKVIDLGSFGLVGSANTKMVVRIYAATTLTAGYIRIMGYTR